MNRIQDLLNQEARAGNSKRYKERDKIRILIKLTRESPPPECWGEDDCSTEMLVRCPWRIDCGDD